MDKVKRPRRVRVQFRTIEDIEKRLGSLRWRADGLVSALGDALRAITAPPAPDAPTFRTRRAVARVVRRLLKMDRASVGTLVALWDRICHGRPNGEGLAEMEARDSSAVNHELAQFFMDLTFFTEDEYLPHDSSPNPLGVDGAKSHSPGVVPHPRETLRADLRWLADRFKGLGKSGRPRKSWPSALHRLAVCLRDDPCVSEDLRSKPRLAVARWARGKNPHLPPIPAIRAMMRRASRS